MNNDILKIKPLIENIRNYILETEHWIFYWIGNKEIQELIKAYPDDYEDHVLLNIINISTARCFCRISFSGHPDYINYIDRYCIFEIFENSVKTNWMKYSGKIKEYQIKELNENLEYYKRKISEIETKIEMLNCE